MKTGILVAAIIVSLSAPAAAATKYSNCSALRVKYAHGVAKSATAARKADGLKGKPFISAALYKANESKDRDRDGVACEA